VVDHGIRGGENMGYHLHEIQVLIRKGHVAKARDRIADAYRRAGAVRQYAADELMVDQATLWRWVKKLEMEGTLRTIEAQAVRRGTKVERRGRPVGAKDSVPRKRARAEAT
jgi:hypothetical protein